MKYTTVYIGSIASRIAVETDVRGYTEGIIESFLPETENWTKKRIGTWIKQNNERMEAICEMLNKKQL